MVEIEDVTGSGEGLHQRNVGNGDHPPPEPEGNPEEGEEETALEEAPPPEELSFNEQVDRARAQYQPTPLEKFLALAKSLILRALVIYFVMTFIRGSSNKAPATTPSGEPLPPKLVSTNIYPNGTEFDMYVYLSEDSKRIDNFINANLLWKQGGLVYGDWYAGPNGDGTYTHSVRVPLSKNVQNNGSFYLHTYIVQSGYSLNPQDKAFSKSRTVHSVKQLNKFKRKRYAQTHNLLTGETTATLEEQEKAKTISSEIISHWHPNMTINLVTDWTAWTPGAVPAPLGDYIEFIPDKLNYKPVLFFNDYWNLRKDYEPINATLSEIPITFTFQPLSIFKWQLYAAQTSRSQWSANFLAGGGEEEEDDQDTLKEAILDTNPYLLGLTFAVSILHSIFEFLAFKNDIQFWNNRKSLEGLSVRSVVFGVFQSLIVLLYVLDNDTNFVIRVSVFIGLIIELWKINKVMDVKVNRENPILGFIPRLQFSDKGSYVESSTRQYDMLAFRYLSWALYPLLAGYAIYSLMYVEQKGWYSWVLSMLYGFLLTFGFIMMTPQLFINYKMKSVAHLPWRMLSYKFLNTFIDDIFAFVIKMPTMYRIGCFRDDVIFFIFLYQRYIYRVDHSRLNEFGVSGEMLEEAAKKKAEKNGALAPTQAQEAIEDKITNGEAAAAPEKKTSPKKSKKSKKNE